VTMSFKDCGDQELRPAPTRSFQHMHIASIINLIPFSTVAYRPSQKFRPRTRVRELCIALVHLDCMQLKQQGSLDYCSDLPLHGIKHGAQHPPGWP